MLEISNLHARLTDGREILRGIDLSVAAGEVHAIMGPNGSGKSTLAAVLAGRDGYEITEGGVTYLGRDLLAMPAEERAREGLFLAFQYPVEIPGVNNMYFLRAAMNAQRRHRGEPELDAGQFLRAVRAQLKLLDIGEDLLQRAVNVGFSGGEKKRNEIFQMAMLEPRLAILDETDSGLDIDALKVVARGVNQQRAPDRAIVMITHYQRLLGYVEPDRVHVLQGGRIIESGDKDLAVELERRGYGAMPHDHSERPQMSAVVDFPVKPEARPYLEAFGRDFGRHAREPDWLAGHRRRSLARFAELGFPTRRSEAWRYLDLRALEADPMLPSVPLRGVGAASARDLLAEIGLAGGTHRLVLVDGYYAPELSTVGILPSGVWLGATATAIGERPDLVRSAIEAPPLDASRPFAALNAAFFADGFVLEIAPGVVLDQPIEIVHLASGRTEGSLHTRSLVAIGAGGRASIFETFAGQGSYWRNDVIELRLAAGAELTRVGLVEEAADALHFGEMLAGLGAASRLACFMLLLGGRTVRHEATVRSEGEATHCALHGAFVLAGRQEANIVTTVDHAAPGGETREIFKGVAAGRAHGAFQGRITVRPGAQKVDAHQLSRNLVLGPRAAIDTKPELEIYADDVKCSHGAAVGDLDEAALFYLRARGIANEEARRILIEAFVREAVELVGSPAFREHLLSRLARRLASLEE